jgi:hypothetical protein
MRTTSQGWARWWLWLWGVVAVSLLVLVFLLPFRWWAIGAAVGFGTLEGIGLARTDDAYPPLTHVIRRYVPRSVAFTAIYGFMGGAGSVWFEIRRPWRLALFAALLGWFTTHFDVTFDDDTLVQERRKNERLRAGAKRLLLRR